MAKDILKKTTKQSRQILGLGITTTVGSLTLGKIGGSGAAAAQAGLSKVAGFAPTMGTLVGGGAALSLTKSLLGSKPRKKKRKL